jgi:hypothetical protein
MSMHQGACESESGVSLMEDPKFHWVQFVIEPGEVSVNQEAFEFVNLQNVQK